MKYTAGQSRITNHATHDQQSFAALSNPMRRGQSQLATLGISLEHFLQGDGGETDSFLLIDRGNG
jgi:hypothetical protein